MIEIFASANHPKFEVVYWDKRVKKTSPKWNMLFLSKKSRYCQNEECDYKMSVETNDEAADGTTHDAAKAETR
jgi:hypothetical protein